MKNSKKIVAFAMCAASICTLPLLTGCGEDKKIKELETQVSGLQSTNTALTKENDKLNSDLTNATYQMFCAVMTQLPMCDLTTKLAYETAEPKTEYSVYESFVEKANKFSRVWTNTISNTQDLKFGVSYKLINSDKDFDVVKFEYNNGHYYAYVYGDKLVSTEEQLAANEGKEKSQQEFIYNKSYLKLDMTYENGDFKSITLSDYVWARTLDGNNDIAVTEHNLSDKCIEIKFDRSKDALAERWTLPSVVGKSVNAELSGVNSALGGNFDGKTIDLTPQQNTGGK